jgi:hypothetical protein
MKGGDRVCDRFMFIKQALETTHAQNHVVIGHYDESISSTNVTWPFLLGFANKDALRSSGKIRDAMIDPCQAYLQCHQFQPKTSQSQRLVLQTFPSPFA